MPNRHLGITLPEGTQVKANKVCRRLTWLWRDPHREAVPSRSDRIRVDADACAIDEIFVA